MTQKQKVLGGVMVLVVVVLFGLLYSQLSVQAPTPGMIDDSGMKLGLPASQQIVSDAAVVPATPDATVDAIIDDALLDDQSPQKDVTDEQDAVKASSMDITNLSQTYDENQL